VGYVFELRSPCCTLNGLTHRTRTGQSRGDLAEAYCEEAKRLVRTRMLGDVGGVRRNPAPIPIIVTQVSWSEVTRFTLWRISYSRWRD